MRSGAGVVTSLKGLHSGLYACWDNLRLLGNPDPGRQTSRTVEVMNAARRAADGAPAGSALSPVGRLAPTTGLPRGGCPMMKSTGGRGHPGEPLVSSSAGEARRGPL